MNDPEPVLLIHGGAGTISRAELTAENEARIRAALGAALAAGWVVLASGGSALDAVEEAVRALEDAPDFNAGRGSVFTSDATIEMDAAIMEGTTRRAGAVTGVRTVRNPVSLARAVMERSPHVMLSGEGAEAFARLQGLPMAPPEYFRTDARLEALERVRGTSGSSTLTERDRHGTVGAVALDRAGQLAAATSTGGRTNKLPGRVGDSPVIGAGTFADGDVAVSCTGDGEAFMRCAAARTLAALVAYRGMDVASAARHVLDREVAPLGGSGGLIVLDRHGRHAMPFNTEGMYRGIAHSGSLRVDIHD